MNGVLFGDKHSYDDWDLILTSKSLGLPTPKTNEIDIGGSDGVLDLTEVLSGDVKFNNRTIAFEFTMQDDYEDFNDKISEIANYLHGRKLKIILDEDNLYYYYGRCTINQWSSDKRIGKIVIYCECEPYKYDLNETYINGKGNTTLTVLGKRKTVCPIITVSADMTLTVNGEEYELTNGDNEIIDVFIREGYNYLKFTGSGDIKIHFRGGVL